MIEIKFLYRLKTGEALNLASSCLASTLAGIIKKELKCIQRACDPDLTESSSDEESTEYVYRAGEGYVPDRKKTDPSIENKMLVVNTFAPEPTVVPTRDVKTLCVRASVI